MGGLSIWHLGLLALIVIVLFGGGGKLSRIMGDFGKGITSFKAGLKEGEKRRDDEPDSIDHSRPVGGQTIEGSSVRQDEAVRR